MSKTIDDLRQSFIDFFNNHIIPSIVSYNGSYDHKKIENDMKKFNSNYIYHSRNYNDTLRVSLYHHGLNMVFFAVYTPEGYKPYIFSHKQSNEL
jgi:hypothetical protein